MTVYRTPSGYTLEPRDVAATPVLLALDDGVWMGPSGPGAIIVYRRDRDYGIPLDVAVALGWCRIVSNAL